MKKIISIFLIVILLSAFLIVNILESSFAESNRYVYDGSNLDTSKYPGFKEKIKSLQAQYPNWTFKVLYTDLNY